MRSFLFLLFHVLYFLQILWELFVTVSLPLNLFAFDFQFLIIIDRNIWLGWEKLFLIFSLKLFAFSYFFIPLIRPIVHLMVMVHMDIYSIHTYQTFSTYYWFHQDVLTYFTNIFDFVGQEWLFEASVFLL